MKITSAYSASRFKEYANSVSYKIDSKEKDYLYVMESQIPGSGKGLFTAISIYKDEIISLFKGKIITDTEAKRRVSQGEDAYFMNLPDGTILDAMKVTCFAKYANDASGLVKTGYKNNAVITLDEDGNVCIVARRNILVGAEIFCSYGKGYWKKHSVP